MKKLIYLFLTVLIVGCSGEDGDNNQSSCNGDNPVYLADNGVTIKARDCAVFGDTGVINGIIYTVVSKQTLVSMINSGQDISKVCTTRINTMNSLFSSKTSFNQPIGNWDVSNVTIMNFMFLGASSFNQPIGNWDVSNVTDMQFMFSNATSFNQSITNWNVSSVTNMSKMFGNGNFNFSIENWNVSSVTTMNAMFQNTNLFNQNLSSWNVDNVISCINFSDNTPQWNFPKPNFTNCNPN